MKKAIAVLCLLNLDALAAENIATFDGQVVHIPGVRLGDKVAKDVYLSPKGAGRFAIHSVGEVAVSEEDVVATYDAATGDALIRFVALASNTYRDVKLKAVGSGELALLAATPLFGGLSRISTPAEYYPAGTNLTLQMVAVLDFNLDGRKDIAAHYWHNTWDAPPNYYGPVSNNLVVYLQNEDRSFRLGNEELFGSKEVDIGGSATRKQVLADFNGDGYTDIAYATNKEDGRSPSGHDSNWSSLPVAVMSNSDGTYRVDEVGRHNLWYHAVTAVKNHLGSHDLVLRSAVYEGPAIAYRYINNTWQEIIDYPPLGNWSLKSTGNLIFTDNGTLALSVYRKEAGTWVKAGGVDYRSLQSNELVKVISWTGDEMALPYVNLFGEERIATAFAETCIMNDGQLFLAQLDGSVMPADWRKQERLIQNDMVSDKPLLPYYIEAGKLVLQESLIPDQDTKAHGYRFECGDKTGDGLDDVLAFNDDGTLSLYVQTGSDGFKKIDGKIFPILHRFNRNQTRGIYEDLDGDAVLDLLLYTNTPQYPSGEFESFPIQVQWGKSKVFEG